VYLQSRYYDPEAVRFINADGLVSTGQGIHGYNMFAYCGNNPVTGCDPTGTCSYQSGGLGGQKKDCGNVYCTESSKYMPTGGGAQNSSNSSQNSGSSGGSSSKSSSTIVSLIASLKELPAMICYGPLYGPIRTMNYEARSARNTNLPSTLNGLTLTQDWNEANGTNKWYEYSKGGSLFHGNNIKIGAPDGREGVYDPATRAIIMDPSIKGTFNYSNPDSIGGTYGHILFDVFPYFLYGGQG